MHPRLEAKFRAYVQAADGLHRMMDDLWAIARRTEDAPFDVWQLVRMAESRLREFFDQENTEDGEEASMALAERLLQLAEVRGSMPEEVRAVWCQYTGTMRATAGQWDYRSHLEELHRLGREAARAFFAACGCLQERLQTECACEHVVKQEDVRSPRMTYAASHRQIEAVFSLEEGAPFDWYTALPFRFMHEYTAHIFALDAKFQIFSDGWMMFAAAEFLLDCHVTRTPEVGFSEEQVSVFGRVLAGPLSRLGDPQRGLRLARLVHGELANRGLKEHFWGITHALCSFQPHASGSERRKFLAQFWVGLEALQARRNGEIIRLLGKGSDQFLVDVHASRRI